MKCALAGYALLVLTPLLAACTVGWSGGPVRVLACSISDSSSLEQQVADQKAATLPALVVAEASRHDPATAVVLSSESGAGSGAAEPEVPVVFSGFVLPDDSTEDTAHEGS